MYAARRLLPPPLDPDDELEVRIDGARDRLITARDVQVRYAALREMTALMGQRSPERIAELERARLRRCGIAAP